MELRIVVKCTVNYEIMYFPLMTSKYVHIKVPVHTLPTKQRASLKWACHAGNGTYKSRLVCSVAVQIKTILYTASYSAGVYRIEGYFPEVQIFPNFPN